MSFLVICFVIGMSCGIMAGVFANKYHWGIFKQWVFFVLTVFPLMLITMMLFDLCGWKIQ